jgi:hypothetical protein
MNAPRLRPDAAEIRRALALLVTSGNVFEIRSPDASNVRLDVRADSRTATVYGYFDNPETAANVTTVAFENAETDGVYLTLNPLHPGCLARARNHFRAVKSKKQPTASDKDVTRRSWLYVDLDVDRPSGICSTHAEKAEAFTVAQKVDLFLSGHGFPRPLVLDSGSGAALLYRVDLPADDEIIPAVLKVLSVKFTVPGSVKVDTTVGNAARICRLPGTVNGKGEDDPERPHRMARLHDVPDRLEIVPRELLEKVVGEPAPNTGKPHNGTDLAGEIVSKHFPDAKPEPYEGGTRWKVTCPFNETHPDAAIFRRADGRPGFNCFHDSCSGRGWRDVLTLLEPDRPKKTHKRDDDEPRELIVDRLSDVVPEHVSWLWYHRVALGKVTLFQGNPGEGKSLVTIELAAGVSTGAPLPGSRPFGPADVILASAEDALADTIRPRLDAAAGDPERVHAISIVKRGDRESFLTLADVDLIEDLVRRTGAKLVVVDPLMAFLGKADAHKDQDVRTALAPLAKMAERTGAAVVVVVHMNKQATTSSAIYRSGGSIGIVGAARTAFLVAPHPEDPDRKVIACVKSNIGPMPPALAYRIEGQANGSARVRFERGTLEITADQLLAAASDAASNKGQAVADAENFLRDRLKEDGRPVADLKADASANGISFAALRRAQKKLQVKAEKATGAKNSAWKWTLIRGGQDAQGAQGAQLSQVVQLAQDVPTPDSPPDSPEIPPDGPDERLERLAILERVERVERLEEPTPAELPPTSRRRRRPDAARAETCVQMLESAAEALEEIRPGALGTALPSLIARLEAAATTAGRVAERFGSGHLGHVETAHVYPADYQPGDLVLVDTAAPCPACSKWHTQTAGCQIAPTDGAA